MTIQQALPPSLTAPEAPAETPEGLTAKGRTASIINRIRAAKNLDEIFPKIKQELADLFAVEQLTVYTVDRAHKELYAKFPLELLPEGQEIRVPLNNTSISGYCARHGKLLNIANAYDADEIAAISPRLSFDPSWDQRSGFRSRQMLAVPILVEHKYLMGAFLLINKRVGDRFTSEEEALAWDIAETFGMAMRHQSQLAQRRPTKFAYLLDQHLLSQDELHAAMADARRQGTDVETVLLEVYHVPKKELGQALHRFYGYPFVEFDEHLVPDRTLLQGVNVDYLKANYWIPLRRDADTIDVLVDNPKDLLKIEHIQLLLPGCKIRWSVGLRKDILQFLAAATGKQVELGSIQEILGELGGETGSSVDEEEDNATVMREDDSAVVRLANQIIVDAYKRGVSDIHIEPYAARTDTVVRFRIDGACLEYQRIPPGYRRALVSRLKIMARLDIAERRKPQDGKIKFRLPNNRELELRVATIPTAGGDEDVVMRLLAASEPLPLDALQMTPRNLGELRRVLAVPYGLLLVVGPTGSGKTTTLHAALGAINTPARKIWTAEDPVEITQYGLRQVQVHARIGFTFAAAMRAFLRADPDVIMVGEMRDEETAHMGIEASLTGHLVLSTLHTNSAPETVTRLLDMGLDPFNFADALLGVLAQRLARTLCKACKTPYQPSPALLEELRRAYGPEAFEALALPTATLTLARATGCEACMQTGYKGRVGLHEFLVASDEVKRLIQTRARISELGGCAQREGMTTLLQDGILKVLQGVTDFAQVKAVASK